MTGRNRRRRRWSGSAHAAGFLAGTGLLALVATAPVVSGTFSSTTGSASSFSAAASFTTYPEAVLADSPWMYHRSDDAPNMAAGSQAYNTAAPARPGYYAVPTDASPSPVAGARLRYNFDEGTNNLINDSSGLYNHGSKSNAVGWIPGVSGFAVNFPSIDPNAHFVRSGSAPLAHTNTAFTLMAWVKLSHAGAPGTKPPTQTVLSLHPNSGYYSGALRYDNSDDKWHFAMTAASNDSAVAKDVASKSTAKYNTWTHITIVHEVTPKPERKLRVVVDAEDSGPGGPGTFAAWDCTNCNLEIGRRRDNGVLGSGFAGQVDEVRVFDKVITPLEYLQEVGFALIQAGQPGALQGPVQGLQSSTSVKFNGITGGGPGLAMNAYNNTAVAAPGPAQCTLETWVKLSGTDGGSMIALATHKTDAGPGGGTPDRVLYVDSGSRFTFLVVAGGVQKSVRSPSSYLDDQWHHVAASVGPAGTKLYVDGALVATDANTGALALGASGYWRWGGSRLDGVPNQPVNHFFSGWLDEVAVYHTQLADDRIAAHYSSNF